MICVMELYAGHDGLISPVCHVIVILCVSVFIFCHNLIVSLHSQFIH